MSPWKDFNLTHIFHKSTSSKCRGTKHLRREKKEKWGEWLPERRSRRRGETVFLGSKAICLPSSLIHSLCATFALGVTGVACHWCHSRVNQSVTGSDGSPHCRAETPQPRGTWDDVTTCSCSQTNHLRFLTSLETSSLPVQLTMIRSDGGGITFYFHYHLNSFVQMSHQQTNRQNKSCHCTFVQTRYMSKLYISLRCSFTFSIVNWCSDNVKLRHRTKA